MFTTKVIQRGLGFVAFAIVPILDEENPISSEEASRLVANALSLETLEAFRSKDGSEWCVEIVLPSNVDPHILLEANPEELKERPGFGSVGATSRGGWDWKPQRGISEGVRSYQNCPSPGLDVPDEKA